MKPNLPLAVAPVIETARLRLRSYARADFERFCAMWNEPAVYRFITGKPLSTEEHWNRLLRYVGCWPLAGFGSWAVEMKDTGDFIGQVGFGDYQRDMPLAMTEPESGWAFFGAYHGNGYASEACRASLQWADQNLGAAQTACIIDPDNMASRILAEKLGYKLSAETTYISKPVMMFHRQREL